LFYASLRNLPTQKLTLTLVGSGYPRNLIAHLETEMGYKVEESEPGLYVARGAMIPVQLIESEKLDARENMWLKNLRESVDAESFAKMLRAIRERGKEARLKAYLNALLVANPRVLKEVKKTMIMTPELREVLIDIGFAAEWEKEGRKEGRKEGVEKGIKKGIEKGRKEGRKEGQMKMAKKLLAGGISPEIIVRASGLTLDEIRTIVN
jgi:hypothetical protein